MRYYLDNFKRLLNEAEEKNLLTEDVSNLINEYIQKSKYDILKCWGNCAFYTQDFINNMGGKVVYMPLANPPGNDPEDHIVPMINNIIIDFAYVPGKGVSKHDRTGNPPKFNPGSGDNNWPKVVTYSDSLFEKNGLYGKLGYLKGQKYVDWYQEYPELGDEFLKNNKYPIILKGIPSYATVEPPCSKK